MKSCGLHVQIKLEEGKGTEGEKGSGWYIEEVEGGEIVFPKLTNQMSTTLRGSACTEFIDQLDVFEEIWSCRNLMHWVITHIGKVDGTT